MGDGRGVDDGDVLLNTISSSNGSRVVTRSRRAAVRWRDSRTNREMKEGGCVGVLVMLVAEDDEVGEAGAIGTKRR